MARARVTGMDERLLRADELGIRLEIVGGLPLWEPSPVYKHQKAVDQIRATIVMTDEAKRDGCVCIHVADVYVQFADGSLKRPDIALFCCEPEQEDEPVRAVPEAVIEVVSRGYEAKDTLIGPSFYLSQGVKDVVVFNPYTLAVLHARRDHIVHLLSPVEIALECGFRCKV